MKAINLNGKRFGRLVVVERDGLHRSPSGGRSAMWKCRCDCGNTARVRYSSLAYGNAGSCGCLIREKMKSGLRLTHGNARRKRQSAEYKVWAGMMARCYSSSPGDSSYHLYRGAGIKVCRRWHAFGNFLADMGRRPFRRATIERINGRKNYSPTNCKWATYKEQANNTIRNVRISYQGRTQTLAQWSDETSIPYSALKKRIRLLGWTPERALTEPSQIGRRRVA